MRHYVAHHNEDKIGYPIDDQATHQAVNFFPGIVAIGDTLIA
jgi:hypothetical protein